ncbi:hypothetical protein O3P69_019027 [Scylla paramamosain]|uniref:Uncharacterized protein n=1 Tax=Scylla paramamosain TaxID=85552 RepID=A0AAW0T736_SCYPA
MEALLNHPTSPSSTCSIPSFVPFYPTSELWKDYYARFGMFAGANSIPEDKVAQVFLTSQTPDICKLLGTLAGQQTPPKDTNALSMEDCQFINSTCRFCQKKGHTAEVCLRKKNKAPASNTAEMQTLQVVRSILGDDPVLQQLQLNGRLFSFKVDSGAKDNFCSKQVGRVVVVLRLSAAVGLLCRKPEMLASDVAAS